MEIVRHRERRRHETDVRAATLLTDALDPVGVRILLRTQDEVRLIRKGNETFGNAIELRREIGERVELAFWRRIVQQIAKRMQLVDERRQFVLHPRLRGKKIVLVPEGSFVFGEESADRIPPLPLAHPEAHHLRTLHRFEQQRGQFEDVLGGIDDTDDDGGTVLQDLADRLARSGPRKNALLHLTLDGRQYAARPRPLALATPHQPIENARKSR